MKDKTAGGPSTGGGYEGIVKRTDQVMCRILLGGRFSRP